MTDASNAASFGFHSTAEEVTEGLDLSGKTYLVTGANSGIGFETARVLALRGAHVIAAARTEEKAIDALKRIGHDGTPLACELSEPASVRAAVQTVLDSGVALDGIIANAGIMALPELTVQHGLELQFLTNHVGHFLLVTGLVEALTPTGRVVMLSSGAHHMAPKAGIEFSNLDGSEGYAAWPAYGQSKLANILFANQLSKQFEGTRRTANSVHPGVIATNLLRYRSDGEAVLDSVGRDKLKSIPQGAATQVWAATHPRLAKVSGSYFADCNLSKTSSAAKDEALAERLWAETERLVAAL